MVQRGRTLTNEDIALAMELRNAGCYYKVIAYAFSCSVDALYCKIKRARKFGMQKSSLEDK